MMRGLTCKHLGVEPVIACGEFRRIRPLMQSTLAARLPFEMFDGVRDVQLAAFEASGFQRVVGTRPAGPTKGRPRRVFFVAGLFADQHDARRRRALAENRLGCMTPDITTTAGGRPPE